METQTAAAQTYIVTVFADTVYRAFLFITLRDNLELVDVMDAPGFIEQELFTESVRARWYKPGAKELTVTNRKIFNLESIKDVFPEQKAVVVDIGTKSSSVVSYKGGLFSIKEEEAGVAKGLLSVLDVPIIRHTFADILPFDDDKAAVLDYLAEKELYPERYPSTMRERVIDLFAARTLIHLFTQRHPRLFSVVRSLDKKLAKPDDQSTSTGVAVLTGEAYLDHFSHPLKNATASLAAFSFLDGAALRGIWNIYQDGQGILSTLGRLKKEKVVVDSLSRFITQVGTVISLEHSIDDGKELGILRFDLGYQLPQEVHIQAGDIVRLPFDGEQTGTVSMELERDVSIAGVTDRKDAGAIEVLGGAAGIIIDARKRTESMSIATRAQLKHWLQDIGLGDM